MVGRWENITPTVILKTLKTAVGFCRPNLGFKANDISPHSLNVDGAMALICSGVDSDIIKIIGHWHSDKILRYLHVQADPLMRNLSQLMLMHGNYSFLPHQELVP